MTDNLTPEDLALMAEQTERLLIATDSTPQLAGEWGPIPVVELTPEELVERYPRTRAEVDAALQVPPTPEASAEWDEAFRKEDSDRHELRDYDYELRPAAYLDNPRPHFTVKDGEWPKLTEQQVRYLQAANARQVHAEWVAAGRPGERPVVEGPLRIRIEPSPGFGKTWLSLLACCGYLRGVVDEKVFMGDLAP